MAPLTMSKKLVAYFSASGVTAKVADIYEICPEVPYTKADLNWMDKNARSTIEMSDKTIRSAIAKGNAEVEQYDVIFRGFPIWWYVAPTIINTFLESYDFGSQFGNTVAELKGSVSESCETIEGKLLNGKQTVPSISSWKDTLDI